MLEANSGYIFQNVMKRGTAHRGRVQAQGGSVEKSCPWAQETPLTRDEGQQKVDTLEGSLTSTEKEGREEAFRQARDYIDRVARAGGVDAPVSKTFPNRSRERSNIRLDIEIITGRAFVPDSK